MKNIQLREPNSLFLAMFVASLIALLGSFPGTVSAADESSCSVVVDDESFDNIDDAIDVTKDGSKVIVSGTCEVGGNPIKVNKSDVTIQADPDASEAIIHSDRPASLVRVGSDDDNLTIRGLKFEADIAGPVISASRNVDNLVIEDNELTGNGTTTVGITGVGNDAVIQGNTISGVKTGIANRDSITITNNTFIDYDRGVDIVDEQSREWINDLFKDNTFSNQDESSSIEVTDFSDNENLSDDGYPVKHIGVNMLLVQEGDSIQEVVDVAKEGDVIKVVAGTYNESVTIDTPITLKKFTGSDRNGSDVEITDTVTVNTSGVTLKDLYVNETDPSVSAIDL